MASDLAHEPRGLFAHHRHGGPHQRLCEGRDQVHDRLQHRTGRGLGKLHHRGIEKAYGTSKDGTRKVERVDLADGRKASDVTNSPDGTVKERGMPQSVHPLDNWFYRKPRIQQAGIEAILIDEPWGQFLSKHHHWTTDEVVRVRCLLRPQPE